MKKLKVQIANILIIILAVALIGVGLFGTFWGNKAQNPYIIVGSVAAGIGSGAFILVRLRNRGELTFSGVNMPVMGGLGERSDQSEDVPRQGSSGVGDLWANSINIYPMDKGGIKFEYMAKPTGMLKRCRNNSRYYFVHIWDFTKNQLVPFILPDDQYFAPEEFANVIAMDANKGWFQIRLPLLEKIQPWAIVAMAGILVLALMIFAGK